MIKKISLPLLASMMLVAVSALLLLMEDRPAEAAFLSSGVGDPFVVNNLTVQSNATVGGTLTATGGFSGNISGNASTATALVANGANCSVGYYPLGINASGAVESCTAIPEVTGLPSGTSGQTLRHNGTSWVGDSLIYNNGTNVGVGTSTPGSKLTVLSGSMGAPYSGIGLFSGSASGYTAYTVGRTAVDGYFGVSGGAGHYLTGSVAGDVIIDSVAGRVLIGTGPIVGTLGLMVNNGNVSIGTTLSSYNLQTLGTGYFGGTVVVGTPTGSSHATTKGYVDSAVGSISYVATAGSLNANGSNCAAGSYPLGVDAAGNAESCTAVSGGLSGTGTTNYVSKWTGSSSQGNSVIYDTGTNIGIGTTNPLRKLHVVGDIYTSGAIITASYFSGNLAGQADYAYSLSSNGSNCSSGYYPLGIDSYGNVESCTALPGSSDIYWTGTATNLNAATGRSSLGLGSLATLSSVTSAYITDSTITSADIAASTIVDADISSSAAISASKIANGTYFITSAGTSGQIWTSDGSGAGYWAAAPTTGVSGSGTSGYIPKWNGSTSVTNSIISDSGTAVTIGGNLTVSGTVTATAFTYSDRRLKQDIAPLSSSLEKIKAVQGVSFRWKKDNRADIGVIAQDLEKVFPDLVMTNPESGFKAVNYSGLVPVLVEAIKQQQGQIDELKMEIAQLKK